MKKIFLVLCFFICINSYAENLLNPPNEEINKVGSYKTISMKIPEKYQNMWKDSMHARYMKDQIKTDSRKTYSQYKERNAFVWNIHTPKNYDPQSPAGILIMPVEKPYEELPQNFQTAIDTSNLILIAPQTMHSHYITEMVYCSIEILQKRYQTVPERLYYVALPDSRSHLSYLCQVDKFKGFINIATNGVGYKRNDYSGKYLRSMEKALKPLRYTFIGVNDFQFGGVDHTEKFKVKDDWNSFSIALTFKENNNAEFAPQQFQADDIFLKVSPTPLIESIQFLDHEIANEGKKHFTLGEEAERTNDIKTAMNHFLQAHKFLNIKALAKYKVLAKELIESETLLKDKLRQKDYPQAYKLASKNVKEYGPEHAAFSLTVLNECKQNRAIQSELKAAAYLLKVQLALKKNNSKPEKIKKACLDIIKFAPGTLTAQKAQKIIDTLK